MGKSLTFQYFVLLLLCCGLTVKAQQDIDLENLGQKTKETLKKNPFKISGGISANTVLYSSNTYNSRDPFTYFLNGNLNLGIYNWSMPISYSLTNQGSQINYQVPFKFNRFSIAPKYKWIKAYLGDVSMSFSPYTYNGLMFTGVGFELTPKIPFKIALMGGRLNKAVNDDGNPYTIPAYKRMGYGADIKWEKEKYKLEMIGFYAKDDINSISVIPDSKNIYPQENLVLSAKGSFKLIKNLEVYGEYSNSALTTDLRLTGPSINKKGITSIFFKTNSSTENNSAYNTGVNLNLKKTSLGIRYEKIDPDYRTLGAYYFNNDLENITLNTAFTTFKDRLNIVANIGRQRDNLNFQKLKQTSRWVGAVNATLKASEKLLITGSYSNFTMFTNNQLNQFTNINNNPLLIQQPRDSVNYKQINQNVNLNVNYTLPSTKDKVQNININYSLNDMVNRENGIVRLGGLSRFHNANINYNLGFPEKKMTIAATVNYTNMYITRKQSSILGPSVSISKSFLKDKLQTSAGVAYNITKSQDMKTDILNLRLGANYIPWEKHNFSFNLINMFRNTNQQIENPKLNELTTTIGYNYSF